MNEVEISCHDTLEKVMITLNPESTQSEHKHYLMGYIDCMFDAGQISEEIRERLYITFG